MTQSVNYTNFANQINHQAQYSNRAYMVCAVTHLGNNSEIIPESLRSTDWLISALYQYICLMIKYGPNSVFTGKQAARHYLIQLNQSLVAAANIFDQEFQRGKDIRDNLAKLSDYYKALFSSALVVGEAVQNCGFLNQSLPIENSLRVGLQKIRALKRIEAEVGDKHNSFALSRSLPDKIRICHEIEELFTQERGIAFRVCSLWLERLQGNLKIIFVSLSIELDEALKSSDIARMEECSQFLKTVQRWKIPEEVMEQFNQLNAKIQFLKTKDQRIQIEREMKESSRTTQSQQVFIKPRETLQTTNNLSSRISQRLSYGWNLVSNMLPQSAKEDLTDFGGSIATGAQKLFDTVVSRSS